MGIRVIDDTTGQELSPDQATNFAAHIEISVSPLGPVFAADLRPIFISKNGVDNVLDNPQWQQIYALFTKMLPTVTQAWDTMVADIQRIIVTSAEVMPASADIALGTEPKENQ